MRRLFAQVGALALLREGRRVEMTTGGEHWRWTRRVDPAFGVRVLSVEVSALLATYYLLLTTYYLLLLTTHALTLPLGCEYSALR